MKVRVEVGVIVEMDVEADTEEEKESIIEKEISDLMADWRSECEYSGSMSMENYAYHILETEESP